MNVCSIIHSTAAAVDHSGEGLHKKKRPVTFLVNFLDK